MMIYIEIVGLDGAGKSSFARSLVKQLGDRSRLLHVSQATITRNAAKAVATSDAISPMTRAMVYMSAHSEAYDRIVPNLNEVDYLVGDRGYACFYAYQYQCPSDVIDRLWSMAMRDLFPDILVFLDTPVWLCQERISRRRYSSEMDRKPASFHRAVRNRYLSFVQSYTRGQTFILDGTQGTNALCEVLRKALLSHTTRNCKGEPE